MFHGIYPGISVSWGVSRQTSQPDVSFGSPGVDDGFLASSQCSILSTLFGKMFAGQLIPGAASEFLSSIGIDVSGQVSRAALT